jgi:sugar phosphate isomerase/epimerase
MKLSVCHYSYHRTWENEGWDCRKLTEESRAAGAVAIDYHVRYLGDLSVAKENIEGALAASGLSLSGLSLSNNFNSDDPDEFRKQVDAVKDGIQLAAAVKAPNSRIFGGHIEGGGNEAARQRGRQRILDGLGEVVRDAEKLGVTLALENHGGLPCRAEEQVEVIEAINSPNLKATIDIGNYMQCGQEGHDAVAIAAPYAAYIHVKDFKKKDGWQADKPCDGKIEPCTVGHGDVDVAACMEELRKIAYQGFIALEYEGPNDERRGVKESLDFMSTILRPEELD